MGHFDVVRSRLHLSRTGRPARPLESGSDLEPLREDAAIVWALDAFPENRELHFRTATALSSLFPNGRVYPVYVLSEEIFADRGYAGFLHPALKPMAMKAIRALLGPRAHPGLKAPRVLMEPTGSQAACARRLVRFAKKVGAVLIAVGCERRSRWAQLFGGSFSECLIDHSPLPTLVCGPQTELVSTPPRVIVFPTDFSETCSRAYGEVLRLAAALGAEIHLYHREIQTIDVYAKNPFAGFGGPGGFAGFSDLGPESHDGEAARWQARAQAKGIVTKFVREDFSETTAHAIVHYIKKIGAARSLAVMVSQTGPVVSALLGSITREVIRAAPCPTFVCSRYD